MRRARKFLLSILFAGACCAQNQAGLSYLLDGVKQIAPGRYNGSLCVFGEQAFPVVNGRSQDGASEPVMAAARLDKGRVVAFGHTGYLEEELFKTGDTARLVLNVARWAAGEKTAPRVGVYKVDGLARQLKGLGLDASDITLDGRSSVDVIFLLPRFLDDSEVPPLLDYVRGGGGVVVGAVGFIVAARDRDKDLATEFVGNRLIVPAGLIWATGELSATSAEGFSTAPLPSELSHAAKALDALEANAAGKRTLSTNELRQVHTTLMRAAADLPFNDTTLVSRLEKVAAPARARAVPSETNPIKKDDFLARMVIALDLKRLRRAAPEEVKAHPAAAEFPGSVPRDAPRVTSDVLVQTSGWRFGWFGTGLYAAPGEVIAVRVPENVTAKGVSVVIGAHTDKLWDLKEWKRIPDISITTPIRQKEVHAANALGGTIYISVPYNSGLDDFVATIAGGVPAPRFVLSETDLSEWRTSIRKRPAPWAELESDKIVLTMQSSYVRELDDPVAVMEMWNRISDLESDLAGHPHWRARAERLVPDIQIEGEDGGAGAHSGYPNMGHIRWARAMLRRDVQDLSQEPHPQLGTYHELGHNLQNADWCFEGAVEATVNLFPLYVFEHFWGIPVAANPRGSKEYRAKQIAGYDFAKPDFEKWKRDPWLSITMYLQLQQGFGWEAYKKVFAGYLMLPANRRPTTDAEKRDMWMVRFSRQVHRNLGPFFQAWGIPTSEAARASIADLPAWMPDEPPGRPACILPNHPCGDLNTFVKPDCSFTCVPAGALPKDARIARPRIAQPSYLRKVDEHRQLFSVSCIPMSVELVLRDDSKLTSQIRCNGVVPFR